MPYQVEVTDTFGGESNYSWVRRYTVDAPTTKYRSRGYRNALTRRAKAAAGWTGMRCEVDDYGDSYTLRPCGGNAPCWIMFITWCDTADLED